MRNVLIATILLGLCQPALAESTGPVYHQAVAAFDSQNWPEAAAKFKQTYQQDPTSLEAEDSLFFWGESLLQSGQLEKAKECFDNYLRQWPEGRRARAARFRTAEALMLAKRYKEATYLIQRFTTLYPADPLLEYTTTYLAEIAVAENDLDQGERLYNKVIRKYPRGQLAAECQLGLARIHAARGNLEASLRLLEPILQNRNVQSKTYREAIVLQSSLNAKLGKPNRLGSHTGQTCQAIDNANQACTITDALKETPRKTELQSVEPQELSPQASEAAVAIASAPAQASPQQAPPQQAQPQASSDSTIINTATEADPESTSEVMAMWRKAHYFQRNQKLGPALVAYEDLYRKYPNTPEADKARIAAARLYIKLQQPSKAKAIYDELLVRAGHKTTKLPKATILFEAALTQEIIEKNITEKSEDHPQPQAERASIALLQQLLRECPDHPESDRAAYRLARSTMDTGDFAAARTYLEKSLQSKNKLIVARSLQLSWKMAVTEHDWDAVRDAAKQLLSLDEDEVPVELDPQARFWLAEADYRTGQYKSARHRFAALAKRIEGKSFPWTGLVALRSAQSLAQLGDFTQARKTAEAAASTYADFADHYEFDYLIGQCAFVQGEHDVARLAFDRVLHATQDTKTETRLLAQEAIASSLFAQEDYESAITEFAKLQNQNVPASYRAKSLHYTALCHERLGKKSYAEAIYQRLVDRYPNYPLR